MYLGPMGFDGAEGLHLRGERRVGGHIVPPRAGGQGRARDQEKVLCATFSEPAGNGEPKATSAPCNEIRAIGLHTRCGLPPRRGSPAEASAIGGATPEEQLVFATPVLLEYGPE